MNVNEQNVSFDALQRQSHTETNLK